MTDPLDELDRLEDNHAVSVLHDYPMGLWLREHPCQCGPDDHPCRCGDD